jgi:outer membrane protein insertion porin family
VRWELHAQLICFLSAVLLLVLVVSQAAQGQQVLLKTNANTQVSRIFFRFTDSRSFTEEELRSHIALTERGTFVGLRNFFSFLPMVDAVGEHPFDPVELQRDVVRLRRFYQVAGFLRPIVTYDVALDEGENLIDVTFVVDEGPPITLTEVRDIAPHGNDSSGVSPEIASEWQESLPELAPKIGSRLNLHDLPRVEAASAVWWNNHGYPFSGIRANCLIDSAARSYVLTLQRNPGPRVRIGTISVSGEQTVRAGAILRELPFTSGDYYSLAEMLEGRREILSLGLFRRAAVTIPQGISPADTVPISVDVTEGPARLISGSGGYDSRGGLTAQAEWLHRNFTGDARTFSVSGLAQTGVWATEDIPEILYRGTVTLTQPYVFHRRLSLVAGPIIEHRDDYRDRSNAIGATASLIYQIDPLRSMAVRYQISDRRIEEARAGEYTSGAIDFLTFLSNQAKGNKVLKNSMALQISYGSLDDMSIPRSGYLLRPSAELTFVPSLNSVEYFRFEIPLFFFVPLNEDFGFASRLSAGSILPFGKGLPQGDETATEKFLQLRDVLFTAGGPEDVRGWGSRLLGPKFPDIRVEQTTPDTAVSVNGYIPIGALSRIFGSLEFRMPFPGLGRSAGIALFFDVARVWSPQPEFSSEGIWKEENGFFYGTGFGLLYRLPVGTVRFDLGYKINPSFQDLREASDIANAIIEGKPVTDVPTDNSKRFHAHFSISVTF